MEDIVVPDLTDPDTCKEQRPLTRRSSKEDDCVSTEQLAKDCPEDKNPESISEVTVAAEDFFKTKDHCDSPMSEEINEGYEMKVIKVRLSFVQFYYGNTVVTPKFINTVKTL